MIRGFDSMWCRWLTRLASLDGRHLCAAWERCIYLESNLLLERDFA